MDKPGATIRPRGLRETAWLMAVFNVAGFVGSLRFDALDNRYRDIFAALVFIWDFLVIWHYWQGRNWARILVMLYCVFVILANILIPFHFKLWGRIALLAQVGFAAFLLYWLNTQRLRDFFHTSTE